LERSASSPQRSRRWRRRRRTGFISSYRTSRDLVVSETRRIRHGPEVNELGPPRPRRERPEGASSPRSAGCDQKLVEREKHLAQKPRAARKGSRCQPGLTRSGGGRSRPSRSVISQVGDLLAGPSAGLPSHRSVFDQRLEHLLDEKRIPLGLAVYRPANSGLTFSPRRGRELPTRITLRARSAFRTIRVVQPLAVSSRPVLGQGMCAIEFHLAVRGRMQPLARLEDGVVGGREGEGCAAGRPSGDLDVEEKATVPRQRGLARCATASKKEQRSFGCSNSSAGAATSEAGGDLGPTSFATRGAVSPQAPPRGRHRPVRRPIDGRPPRSGDRA